MATVEKRSSPHFLGKPISRREFGKLAAASAVVTTGLSIGRTTAYAADEATLYIMGGYDGKPLFEEYVAKHGAAPGIALWADEDEALTKLRAGLSVDVAYCGSYSVDRWRDAGVIQPIDVSRLTHWDELYPGIKKIKDMSKDGKEWFVPLGFGITSIVYRSDLVDVKEESWGLLWDERYAGRLAMYDNTSDGVAGASLYAGVDPYTMDDAGIAKVREVLLKQRSLLRMYTTDPTVLSQALASGEIVAASGANDVYAALKKQGIPVGYMLNPKEKLLTWAVGLTISSDTKNLDKAYDVINSLTSQEAGKFWVRNYGFGHANQKAYSTLSDDDIAKTGLPKDPTPILEGGVFESRMQNEAKIAKMFEEVKAGM